MTRRALSRVMERVTRIGSTRGGLRAIATQDPYRLIAPVYDLVFDRMNRGLRSLAFRLLPTRANEAVLDVGCGTGAHLALYRDRGCATVGIDPSAAMLGQARRRLGGGLCRGDARHLPFHAGSFGLVIMALVLHEMSPGDRRSMLAEAARVLHPDGRVLIIDYGPGPIRALQGWLLRAFITTAEVAAGRRHFRNYRHFIGAGGIPGLVGGGVGPGPGEDRQRGQRRGLRAARGTVHRTGNNL